MNFEQCAQMRTKYPKRFVLKTRTRAQIALAEQRRNANIYRRAHQNWITLQQLRTYQLIEYKRTRVSQLSAEMSYLMPVQPSDPTASVIGTRTRMPKHTPIY
jgi:hypothetical protein